MNLTAITGMDPMDSMIAVTDGFGTAPGLSAQGPSHSSGVSYADIAVAQALGLGNQDVNSGQTVNQAIAAAAVHSGLNNNIGQVMGALGGPVVGMIATAANAVAQGHSFSSVVGQIAASIVGTAISNATGLTVNANTVNAIANGQIGQAAMGLAIGQVAQSTGLSIGTVTAAMSGNLGAAVANTVMGQVVGAAAQAMSTGPLGGMAIGAIANQSGIPAGIANSINQSAIGQAVNSATSAINSSISSAGIGVPGGPSGVASAVSAASSGADGSAPSLGDVLTSAVNSGELEKAVVLQPQAPGASAAPAGPSKSDKYWQNLYSDLGMSFSKPPAQKANNTANEMYANQAKAQALMDAEKKYTDIFGALPSDVAASLASAADPLKYVSDLTFGLTQDMDSDAADQLRADLGLPPEFKPDPDIQVAALPLLAVPPLVKAGAVAFSAAINGGIGWLFSLGANRNTPAPSEDARKAAITMVEFLQANPNASAAEVRAIAPTLTDSDVENLKENLDKIPDLGTVLISSSRMTPEEKAEFDRLNPYEVQPEDYTDTTEEVQDWQNVDRPTPEPPEPPIPVEPPPTSAPVEPPPTPTPAPTPTPPVTPPVTPPTPAPVPVEPPKPVEPPVAPPVIPPVTPPVAEPPAVTPTEPNPPAVTPPTGGEVVAVDPDEGTALVVNSNGNVEVVDNTDGTLVPGDVVPVTQPVATPEVTPSEVPPAETLPEVNPPVVTPSVVTPPTANITSEEVRTIVDDALKNNPSLTAEDVQKIVSDAVATIPNLTADQVREIVGEEVAKAPTGATPTDVENAIDSYMEANPGLSKADVTNAFEDYMTANPGLTASDLSSAISTATKDLATTEQVGDVQKDVDALGRLIGAPGADDAAGTGIIGQLEAMGLTDSQIQGLIGSPADRDTAPTGLYKVAEDAAVRGENAAAAVRAEFGKVVGTPSVKDDPATPDINESVAATGLYGQIEASQTKTSGAIGELTADVQAKFDALTAEQKVIATNLEKQGVDLNEAIETAKTQTQQQITDLGIEVDARINELMQQGQTYQQATQTAFAEVNAKNQEMAGLIGTQGRSASQQDIDALTEMLGGQRSMDLAYDVTGDKQITQADIDFLTQVVGGVKTDWTAPQQSPWAATGLYGQIQANELRRQQDLAAADAQRVADQQAAAQAAATRARQANIRTTATRAQTSSQGIMQQLEAMQRAGMAPQQPAQLVEAGPGFDVSAALNTGFFSGFQAKKEQQNQQPTTKIAAGGYIDDLLAGDLSVDELLDLLR
jgi:hypothetical protein